mgnify:CR=1 FL=1
MRTRITFFTLALAATSGWAAAPAFAYWLSRSTVAR